MQPGAEKGASGGAGGPRPPGGALESPGERGAESSSDPAGRPRSQDLARMEQHLSFRVGEAALPSG